MNRFEVTVRWTVHAASTEQARLEAEVLAKQGNHPRHGVERGALHDLGVEVVLDHPERGFLRPRPTGKHWRFTPVRRAILAPY